MSSLLDELNDWLPVQKESGKRRKRDSKTQAKTYENETSGVVTAVWNNLVDVQIGDKNVRCKIKKDIGDVAVGDRARMIFERGNDGVVVGHEERKNSIVRMRGDRTRRSGNTIEAQTIAANIDLAVIVCAAKDPDFDPRFVDRFLVAIQFGGVDPFLLINKSDLGSKMDEARALYGSHGVTIMEVSTKTNLGMDALRKTLLGKTVVMLGNSGVGKSSLIHLLVPEQKIRVREVSHKSGTGMHTTTASMLYDWAPNSFIIDTPGIKSLG